jgi:cysteinyl-tRNA synthetase
VLLVVVLLAAGCAAAEHPSDITITPPQGTLQPRSQAERDGLWAAVNSWVYQLTNYADDGLDEIAATAYDLAVIDLTRDGESDYFTPDEIGALQATGKIVLAYFEIGAIEEYRPEWTDVPAELKLGAVGGWPDEQYVAYWDERWWPVVQGRIDRALAAGFDGVYLDIVNGYEEIPEDAAGTDRDDLARRMVDLLIRISTYAKQRDTAFRIVPQNAPELYTYPGYLDAIDGLGMEELTVIATDSLCDEDWCAESFAAAKAVHDAGKLVLTVDYANRTANIDRAYRRSRDAGFVPYVTVVDLDRVRINAGWEP